MHWKFPFTMIPNREDRASASSIECVVRMTVAFFFSVATLDMTFHINLLAFGSMPVEGSSKKMMRGLPIIAMATDSFRLLPPERVPDSLSSYYVRFISVIFLVMASSFCSLAKDFRS